jgi:hypothetical protein
MSEQYSRCRTAELKRVFGGAGISLLTPGCRSDSLEDAMVLWREGACGSIPSDCVDVAYSSIVKARLDLLDRNFVLVERLWLTLLVAVPLRPLAQFHSLHCGRVGTLVKVPVSQVVLEAFFSSFVRQDFIPVNNLWWLFTAIQF